MFVKNGRRFNLNAYLGSIWVDDNGTQHPGSLLRDALFRAEHQIEEIPDPARGDDELEYTQEIDVAPYIVITPKSPDQIAEILTSKLTNWIQSYMDEQAQKKGYDNILSACSYASIPNAFQAEAITFLEWRSACWAYGYQLLSDIQAQTATVPDRDTLLSALPVRVGGEAYVPE